jgi:Putative adhesin
MSITEDAPASTTARRSPLLRPGRARRASPWWWLVLACSLLLAVTAVALGAWWIASGETQNRPYRVLGPLSAIELDVGSADVEIVGGASTVEVERTAEFAFGRPPDQTRTLEGDVLRITSRCPDTVIGTCRAAYRISVRANVDVNVRTTSGRVRITGLNASARIETGEGAIAVDGFCGFRLSATSGSGDVRGAADCSPDRLELRSGSGDVNAVVPAGRYRVDASSDRGSTAISDNLATADDAPFAVQAISGSGDVTVDGRG